MVALYAEATFNLPTRQAHHRGFNPAAHDGIGLAISSSQSQERMKVYELLPSISQASKLILKATVISSVRAFSSQWYL